ncbi:MAG: hydroxymyristoyl-ACP dehydratase [Ferruginibacter sp.]
MTEAGYILNQLPYTPPFLFVDELFNISENGISGYYTFKDDEYFYRGHFKNNPVTPGVILIETMAQIGLVCLGICLSKNEADEWTQPGIVLSSADIEFLSPVYPGEKVTVVSQKKYFRFNKLKCDVEMKNSNEKIVCRGSISGMIINKK